MVLKLGFTLPLGIVGWFYAEKEEAHHCAIFCVVCFAESLSFSTIYLDNTKFLVWGSLEFLVRRRIRFDGCLKKHWSIRVLTALLFLI